MQISNLIDQLGEANNQANETYKQYKAQKETVEQTKELLRAELDKLGLKTAKSNKYQAIVAQRVDIEVSHEQSVLDWLKESPNVEEDAYIGLKLTPFKGFAKQVLKETGEIIPGTETIQKESLTIRSNK